MYVYQLTVRHPAFEEIKTLLIAISSLATAVSYHTDGHAQFNPGDYVTVECRHMSGRVRLPIHGPVQAAIAGRLPDTIEITVLQGRDAERGFSVYTDVFQDYFRSLVHPLVLSCYQRHRSTLHAKFGGSRIAWPPSWQFAWAVRNASAHAGRAFDSKPRKPVVWRSLEFSPEDEPQ
jgi:hypothetical protein